MFTILRLYSKHMKLSTTILQEVHKMENKDVRRTAAGAGVKLWQIAEALGISDCSLSRKLRKKLPPSEKEKILSIIAELGKEAG